MDEGTACIACGSGAQAPLFSKKSEDGREYRIVRCSSCGLRFVSPRPREEETARYYGRRYFTTRTSRGYDDYFSPRLRGEIERVFALNLADLDFHRFESAVVPPRRSLDIGCAAGYFVNYMRSRGWQARGIDVSADCVRFASRRLKLPVARGNYLERPYAARFHLITLWATIEHMHRPDLVLEKAHEDLEENGMLFISTCRAGGLNFMRLFGEDWRFYNVPEHLYFFSRADMTRLLRRKGFEPRIYRTYGSGVSNPGSLLRKIADFSAKRFYLGDMMIMSARKRAGARQ